MSKLELKMAAKDLEAIRSVAKKEGISLGQLIRDSLRIGIWYHVEIRRKKRLFVKDAWGMRELESQEWEPSDD